ncbi:head-to-tail joining protein [Vibrio phage 1.138.O._10N.261.48.A1]|nr:head-to-tail joining protein [Vibrio phage 1.138.O._10N.261.48.A1]
MPIEAEMFIKRFKKAKQERGLWDSLLEEAYDLFLPNRQSERVQTKGNRRFTRLFDSTGVESLQEWADVIKQGLMPSNQKWANAQPSGKIEAEVELGNADKGQRDELARQLEIITSVIFKYIHASNFDQAVHESLQDAGISTGALLVLDNDDVNDPIRFVSVPSSQVILEGDGKGGLSGVYREHELSAEEIKAMFPDAKEDANIEEAARKDPKKQMPVIEGVVWDIKKKEWEYVIYIKKAQNPVYFRDVYKVTPWCIFRANVAAGETMGRGNALTALPTMRTLNKLESQLIYNNDMAINPPLIMDTNMSILDPSNVRLAPKRILPVNYNFDGQTSAFRYLETSGTRFNVGENMKQGYQNKVRNMFALPMLGDMTDPTKSATEMNIRNQQALSKQAAMFGRLSQELVTSVIIRVHHILSKYDIVPKELSFNGEAVAIKATSPLARVQDMADLEGLLQYEQYMMSKGEMGMAMMAATIDIEQANVFTADKMGVPAQLKLDDSKRKAAFKQLQGLAQQQAQAMAGGQQQ